MDNIDYVEKLNHRLLDFDDLKPFIIANYIKELPEIRRIKDNSQQQILSMYI